MKEPLYKIGSIKTPHGKIKTPALIPVVATSYGIWDHWIKGNYTAPWDVAQATILSLYHILQYQRKHDVFNKGIHEVLGSKNPVLIDSGGFQYMKKGAELDPADVLEYQLKSKCDIGVTFDYPIVPELSENERRSRLERSIESANLMLEKNKEMMLYGAIHGSNPEEIREYISKLSPGFMGYGIGSLVPKKSHYAHLTKIIYSVRTCTDKPLHAFGITGFPALYALAYLGVNTFDSWTYVVAAAYKEYIHPQKLTRVKKLKEIAKLPECDCSICAEYKLKDFIQPNSESEILLALHNLNIFLRETQNIREAMADNELEKYVENKSKNGNRNISIAFEEAKKIIKDQDMYKGSSF